jgi:hypothetical protein
MRIGICTFHWADNYGAMLQAHALQRAVVECGHTADILDYRPFLPVGGLRAWVARTPYGFIAKMEARYRAQLFTAFRNRYLTMTGRRVFSPGDLAAYASAYDVLIAGSDQIWNPRWLQQSPGMEQVYFLRFDKGAACRRIAYAASFGHADIGTIEPAWREQIGIWLKDFYAISVREASGRDIVQNLTGRNDTEHVADPTMLLERQHYETLAGPATEREDYLFNFMLHGLDSDADRLCREIAEGQKWRVVKCDASKTALHRGWVLPSPGGWLKQIRDAGLVVTNSFHCTVFCLIFHVPFVTVLIGGPVGSMNTRVVELLNACGLGRRIVSPGQAVDRKIFFEPVDWTAVDRTIKSWRDRSKTFLSRSLREG